MSELWGPFIYTMKLRGGFGIEAVRPLGVTLGTVGSPVSLQQVAHSPAPTARE